MHRIVILVGLLAIPSVSGCSPTSKTVTAVESLDGQRVELVGEGVTLPDHAEKSNGVGIVTEQGEFLFVGRYRPVPEGTLGARLRVRGVVRKRSLPMFHQAPGDEVVPQGVPVSPDTDIATESVYYVIEDPSWELAKP